MSITFWLSGRPRTAIFASMLMKMTMWWLSKDVDFKHSYILRQTPRKLIRINLGNISNTQLVQLFDDNLKWFVEIFATRTGYVEIGKQQIAVIKNEVS